MKLDRHFLSWLRGWHLHHGSWWMVQWSLHRWFSLGVHLDAATRTHPRGFRYGPYVDFHLPCLILSLGRNPAYSCELDRVINASRGGLS